MLRHPASRVDHFIENPIAEIFQSVVNHLPGAPFVMRFQVLDIFEQQHRRTFRFHDGGQIEKKIALRHAIETMRHAEALAPGYARDRERLTGEASGKNIVMRYPRHVDSADIAVRSIAIPGLVGFLGIFIPLAGKSARSAQLLKRAAKAADSGEQIDKAEGPDCAGQFSIISTVSVCNFVLEYH